MSFLEWAKLREIVERWNETGLLEGVGGDYHKKSLAMILESQRLFNESLDGRDDELVARFRRLSIPLVKRIGNLIAGSLEPCQYMYRFETVQLPLKSLDVAKEAELVAEMATKMSKELVDKFGSKLYVHHFQFEPDGSVVMNYDISEALTSTADCASFARPVGIGMVTRHWPDEDPFFRKKKKRRSNG